MLTARRIAERLLEVRQHGFEHPGIDLVLGGHEHENWFLRRGAGFTPIVKADANVRSVAVVTLIYVLTTLAFKLHRAMRGPVRPALYEPLVEEVVSP